MKASIGKKNAFERFSTIFVNTHVISQTKYVQLKIREEQSIVLCEGTIKNEDFVLKHGGRHVISQLTL